MWRLIMPVRQFSLKIWDGNEILKTFIKLNGIKMGTSEPLFVIIDIQDFNLNFRRAASFKFTPRQQVLSSIRSHPTFTAAMDHQINNCRLLDNESLMKTFVNVFQIKRHSTKWDEMIEEPVRRKSELSLKRLTKVIVTLKEHFPENLDVLDALIAELSPHIEKMENSQDVMDISHALSSFIQIVPHSIVQEYVKKLNSLYERKPAIFTSSLLLKIQECLLSYQSQLNPCDPLWNDVNPTVEKYEKLLMPHISQLKINQLKFLIGLYIKHKKGEEMNDALSRVKKNPTVDLLNFSSSNFKYESREVIEKSLNEWVVSDEIGKMYVQHKQEVKTFLDSPKYNRKGLVQLTLNHLDWIETTNYKLEQYEKSMGRKIHQLVQDFECRRNIFSRRDYSIYVAFLIAINHPDAVFNPYLCRSPKDQHFERMMRQAMKINYMRSNNTINLSQLQNWARLYTCFPISEQELGSYFDATMNVDWCSGWPFLDDLLILIIKTGYYHPPAFEKMSKFIRDHPEELEVNLEVLTNFMRAAYCIGADTEKVLKAIHLCVPIIEDHFLLKIRNGENLHTFPELQTLLSMNFYGHTMEKEIFNALFRVTPQTSSHIQDMLMKLNRAICIDQPSLNSPRMCQKYWEKKVGKKSHVPDVNKKEIAMLLMEIVGSSLTVYTNPDTRFGCQVDLVLFLNIVSDSQEKSFTKIAVLIEEEQDYTRGKKQFKGDHQQRTRQLEKLGYNILYIDLSLWKSLKNNREKFDYLYNLIRSINSLSKN